VSEAHAGTEAAPGSGRPGDRFFAEDKRPIFLYDGVCRFCNAGVNFVLDHDSEGRIRMAALQSDEGRELLVRAGREPDDISSIVYIEEGGSAIKSQAVLAIGKCLDRPFPQAALAAGLLAPRAVKDLVYDVVAENRYNLMGEMEACRLSDPAHAERFLS